MIVKNKCEMVINILVRYSIQIHLFRHLLTLLFSCGQSFHIQGEGGGAISRISSWTFLIFCEWCCAKCHQIIGIFLGSWKRWTYFNPWLHINMRHKNMLLSNDSLILTFVHVVCWHLLEFTRRNQWEKEILLNKPYKIFWKLSINYLYFNQWHVSFEWNILQVI